MTRFWKKPILAIIALGLCLPYGAYADEYVRGYTRSNGTYVSPHYRSSPNSTVRDNFSYSGNTNPYTGSTGTNRYSNNPSSGYYQGYSTPSYGLGLGN
jgi:hypothetical protein